ncbi:MAG TPA: hypothetical protein VGK87_13630 [Anaerolineae bacterium]
MKAWRLMSVAYLAMAVMLVHGSTVNAANLAITLKPGQTATIPMKLWCLDFGKPFPQSLGAPGARAPDGVVAVLQAAIARNTVNTNAYETQLAIWRVTTGKFNDFGQKGTVLAQEIYSDSLKITVQPVPATQQTFAALIANGTLSSTIVSFSAQKDAANPGLPGNDFFGTGKLVVTNVSTRTVQFVVVEGGVFAPPSGVDAQTLVSHQDTSKVPLLPATGADLQSALSSETLLAGAAGIILLAFAAVLMLRARPGKGNA